MEGEKEVEKEIERVEKGEREEIEGGRGRYGERERGKLCGRTTAAAKFQRLLPKMKDQLEIVDSRGKPCVYML